MIIDDAPRLDQLDWLKHRPVPLDLDGPVDVPFEPVGEEWFTRSPIERFDYIVAKYGDRLAVDDGRSRLTYAELQRVARALAHQIDATAPPGQPIAAVFRYTVLLPAVILACFAAGRPFIPVDIGHPIERQRMVLDNSGVASVVVQRGIAREVALPAVPVIEADLDHLRIAPDQDWPDIAVEPTAVAGATYTSGSTGRPKAIAWSMRGVMPTLAATANTRHLNPDDKIITLASLAATGLGDTLTAMMNGAALRIVEMMSVGLGEALRVLGEERVTILSFVPAVLRNVMQLEGAAHAFRHLRLLELHGDVTLASDVAFFRTKLPPTCHIRILLGSMEAGSLFHWYVPREFVADGLALPCGYLSEMKAIALLDAAGRPVAPGEPGEILVRGRSMALGFWQGGKVVPGPFRQDPDDPDGRLYPMGDLVRMRPDGLVEFVGRRDRQVKVRGQRADLGDIEAALHQHPEIADVAVIASPSTTAGDAIITAYCVPVDPAAPPDPASLRSLVAAETAPHMAPARFRFLDIIPRLPNYKADLVKLAALAPEEPDMPAAAASAPPERPADPTILAAVERAWRETLGAGADPRRGWAAGGGDSLKALHMLFRVEDLLGSGHIAFDVMDEHSTAHDLAVAIGALGEEGDATDERPTILFFPGIGGDEPAAASFRREIAPLGRVVTVRYPGAEAEVAAIGDLDAVSEAAIAQLGKHAGPVHVIGHSFGGAMAVEVARRLTERGTQVPFCGMLDTLPAALFSPEGAEARGAASKSKLRQIAIGLGEAHGKGRLYDHVVQVGSRWLLRARGAGVLRRLSLAARPVAPRTALNMQHMLVTAQRGRLLMGWSPPFYPGTVWLFRSEDSAGMIDPLWSSVVGELRVIDVAGSHISILLAEHGRALAAALGRAMAEATAATTTGG